VSSFFNLLHATTVKDSLRLDLHSSKIDTAKVNLYNTLALQIYQTEQDTAILYTETAIQLAKQLNYPLGEARGNYVKGRILLEQARNKDCLQYFKKALKIYDRLDNVERFFGDTHLSLGRAYDFIGDYYNSLDHFQKSEDYYQFVKNKKGIANCNVNIGIIHDRMKDHKTAIKYYKIAEEQYKESNDSVGLVYIYNNIGYIDYQLGNYEDAKMNYQKGMHLAEETKFETMLPFLYNNLGGLLNELGSVEEAEEIYKKANVVSTKINNRDGIVNSLMALANINFQERDYQKHLDKILWAYEESHAQGNKSLIKQTAHLLSRMYAFKGDKTKAHSYLQEAYTMQDSLNSTSLIQETSGLETQYRLEQRKRQEQLKLETRDRQIRYGLLLLLGVCSLLGGFLFLKNSQNKAKDALNSELMHKNEMLLEAEQKVELRNKELEKYIESNIQLEQFAHFASHDLKSPLRTIASFTGLLKNKLDESPDEKTQSYIHAIETGTKRMNALVVDLLDYSKVNSQVLNAEEFDFNDIYEEVKQNLSYAIEETKVELSYESNTSKIVADRSKVKLVLENLISNAVKFSSSVEKPIVQVRLKEREEDYLVSVRDNGIGIENKYEEEIFKAFKQLHTKSKYEGTGLGLAICKNIIEKHGGKIWVSSKETPGTSMRFSIPKNI